jgi:tetratricopeptide (TPR) repeat protein
MDKMLTTTLTTTAVMEPPPVESGGPPVESGGPASADTESAQTSNAQGKSRLIISESPIEVVTYSTGFTGRLPHDTPVDPALNALLRTYLTANLLDRAAALCRERQHHAGTERERTCWFKDLAIVRMAEGKDEAAYDLLLTTRAAAEGYRGAFRSRLDVAFARVHESLGMFDPAFEYYTSAHFFADESGDHYTAAQIDTDTGRCYTAADNPKESHRYFDRAYAVALKSQDILLLAEVDESRALACEAERDYTSALTFAARSLFLLAPTDFHLARAESEATYNRISATRGEARTVFNRIEGVRE